MFDCVMPTRNGRNALAFTVDGPMRLRNAKHRRDPAPVESGCACYCCANYQPGVPAPPVRGRRDARADAAEPAQHRVLPAADGGRPRRRSRTGGSRRSAPGALPAGTRLPRLNVPIVADRAGAAVPAGRGPTTLDRPPDDVHPASPTTRPPRPQPGGFMGNPMFLPFMIGLMILFWVVVILPMSRRQKKEQEQHARHPEARGEGADQRRASSARSCRPRTARTRSSSGRKTRKLRIKRNVVVQVLGTDEAEAAKQ